MNARLPGRKEVLWRSIWDCPSEPREVLDNKTPFDLFTGKNEKKLLDLLNLRPVPPDEVMLSPKLLNLRIR